MTNKTILIIDCDEDYALLIKANLEFSGFNVIIATDTYEGLQIIREINPDLIILELIMPRTTGNQLINILKGEPHIKEIPILVLSEAETEDVFEQAIESGANDFLKKPSTDAQINQKLEAILQIKITSEDEPASDQSQEKLPQPPVKTPPVPEEIIGMVSQDEEIFESLRPLEGHYKIVQTHILEIPNLVVENKINFFIIDFKHHEDSIYYLLEQLIKPLYKKKKYINILISEDEDSEFLRFIEKKPIRIIKKPFSLDAIQHDLSTLNPTVFARQFSAGQSSEDVSKPLLFSEADNTIMEDNEEYQAMIKELSDQAPCEHYRKVIQDVESDQLTQFSNDINIYATTRKEKLKSAARDKLNTMFWVLFKALLMRPASLKISVHKKLVVRYGLIEKTLLSDDLFKEFFKRAQEAPNFQDIPIYYLDEWLNLVHEDKIKPSGSKLGASSGSNRSEAGVMDAVVAKEFQACRIMMKILLGRYGNPFPVLESARIKNINSTVIFREKVTKIVKHIDRYLDPTAFDRHHQGAHKHIIPNFLILPVSGSRGVCWEPYEVMDRVNSRGRIILPLLTLKEVEEIVIKSIGDYRWESELGKTLRYWEADSIITAYYRLYRKKTRFDVKQRFLDDYYIWLTREAHSRAILSKETRQILWRFCPFSNEIKIQLLKSETYKVLLSKKELKTG